MNWLPPSIKWNPTNKLFGQFRLKSEHRRAKAAIPTPGSRPNRNLGCLAPSRRLTPDDSCCLRRAPQQLSISGSATLRPLGCITARGRFSVTNLPQVFVRANLLLFSKTSKERANVFRHQFGLLRGPKMASAWHFGPALNVVAAFDPATGRKGGFFWKACNRAGHGDEVSLPELKRRSSTFVI